MNIYHFNGITTKGIGARTPMPFWPHQALEALSMVAESVAEDGRNCTKCGNHFPWREFYQSRRDGIIPRCRACTAAIQKAWRGRHRDRLNAKQRARLSPSYKGPANIRNDPVMTAEGRLCSKCDRRLPVANFAKHAGCVDGLARRCNDCAKAQHLLWRERNREHVRRTSTEAQRRALEAQPGANAANLKRRRYKLSPEQIEEMLSAQGHKCLICEIVFVGSYEGNHRPCVDHCHETKKIRGILCNACNTAIGMLKDNPLFCEAAAKYLRRNGCQ